MPTLTVKVVGIKGVPEGKGYAVKVSVGEGKAQKTSKTSSKSTEHTFSDPAFSLVVDSPDSDSVHFVIVQSDKKVSAASFAVKDLVKGEETSKTLKTDKNAEISVTLTAVDFGKDKPKKKSSKSSTTSAAAAPKADAESAHLPPIPPTERLESLFEKLLEELAMPAAMATSMRAFPPVKKWELICQRRLVEKERETSTTSLEQKPEYWVSALKADANVELLTSLGLRLGHELVGWLKDFATLGGISQMTNMLHDITTKSSKKDNSAAVAVQKELVNCFSKLLNNKAGLDLVATTDNAVKNLLLIFSDSKSDSATQALVAKLLSVIALSEEGHAAVLAAFSHFKEVTGEKVRFKTIIKIMKDTDDSDLKANLLTFLNAVVSSPDDVDEHTHLRKELEDAGMERALDSLRKVDHAPLEVQITIYDEEREHDLEVLKQRFAHVADLRLDDVRAVFTALTDLAKQTGVTSYFQDILTALVSLKPDSDNVKEQWVSAAKIIRQLSNQKKVGEISFQQLVKAVGQEVRDVLPLKQRIDELQEEVSASQKELATKKIEMKEKSAELEKLKEELNSSKSATEAAKAELQTKITALEADVSSQKKQISTLEAQVAEAKSRPAAVAQPAAPAKDPQLEQKIAQMTQEIATLKRELDSARAAATSGGPPPPPPPGADGGPPPPPPPPGGDGGPPPPPPPPGGDGGPPPPPPPPGSDGGPPPPPPPPGAGGPPPPPPPPGMGGPPGPPPPPGMGPPGPPPPPGMGPPGPPPPGGLKLGAAAKKRPEVKPSQKVRGLQWSKLVAQKVNGTFFGALPLELDGFKLDFNSIESKFVQIQKAASEAGADTPKKKEGPVTILDPKTGQNLAIFLNGFKNYKYAQVADAIRNMDDSIISASQVATLITLLPPPEELANVKDYLVNGGEKDKLGPAEQFALELSEVPAAQTRLKAFNYKATFESRKSDIKPGIEAVVNACSQVRDSKRLAKVLEVVLHVGNFLNAGTNNGQAYGFKLNTLGKLGDAKTTDNKSNLLTVIVEMIEEQDKELIEFAKDLDAVESAVRVNMGALQGDLTKLTRDFDTIVKKSLESVEKSGDNDLFHQKIADFIASAESDLAKMNEDFKKMEGDYESLVKFFAEDPKAMGPDEFFPLFKNFMDAVADVRKKLEQARINAEKEAKRAQAKVAGAGKKVGMALPGGPKKMPGQAAVVDELFGQLQAGNMFKLKRSPAAAAEENK